MKYITRTVVILSFVSLFTDLASEMLYPVMPVYLQSIGFSIVLIGVLEGVAEATAGLSKGYFGKMSDRIGRRVPFVQAGYALSSISKPMMAISAFPLWIFLARTIDRCGKGIRTGARDAILSDEATPETKGKVFGFHRSMDTLGAVLGPSIALLYLYFYPHQYKRLFYIAFLPGLAAVVISLTLNEKTKQKSTTSSASFFAFLHYWKESPLTYRKLVAGLLLFALFNSSDVFLLLKARQSGLNDAMVIGAYIFYNLVYALSSFPVGMVADKMGLKTIFVAGLALFATVYLGMAFTSGSYLYFILFFVYGLYAAATEGIAKAWITNITDKKDTATAIGFFAGFQSICALFASSFAGFMWYTWGAASTFVITSAISVLVIFYFLFVVSANAASSKKAYVKR